MCIVNRMPVYYILFNIFIEHYNNINFVHTHNQGIINYSVVINIFPDVQTIVN